MEKMTEHEKLEYIHSTLQDVQNCIEFAKLKGDFLSRSFDYGERDSNL